MHDAQGRKLRVGDKVILIARITKLDAFEEYCNASIESVLGRRPDGQREYFSAFNTGVLLRANLGDENNLDSDKEE